MELNTRAKKIFENMKKYSSFNDISTMGSEYLVLAMYEIEDSLCRFLLNEYEVTKEEIEEKTNNIFILRKKDREYNKTIEDILNRAQSLALGNKISEEHIFMAVLHEKNSIAANILESLGLDLNDLIEDVKEIYDFSISNTDELPYVKNLTKAAKNDEIPTFVGRKEYLDKINIITHRRFKSNPLLIGNAGVGKTALVEGYAKMLVDNKSDITILSINLTSMLAGTRYRGDFEERFDKFIKEIASRKNVILFIDEIHTIMGAATTDGNLDAANMLKPFLARGDIRLIGATTLEEYHRLIENDKALSRRFAPVFVSEPTILETKEILLGIKDDYTNHHNVRIDDDVLEYLLYQSDKKIIKKNRPDKCIDLLDEALSACSISNKTRLAKDDVDEAIARCCGGVNISYTPKHKFLNKYKWLLEADLLDSKPMMKILFSGSKGRLRDLALDLAKMLNASDECILELDLACYKSSFMISSLIGAPPGYVGYDDEGILSKHLLSYPTSIVVFKNFKDGAGNIKGLAYNMLSQGFINDQRGRRIDLGNCCIIVEGEKKTSKIGFNDDESFDDSLYDECILEPDDDIVLNSKYEEGLRRLQYEVSFDFDINYNNKKLVDEYLFKLLSNEKSGSFVVSESQIK